MEESTIFRKAVVGGFRKEDVIDYIENLEVEKEKLKLALSDSNQKLEEAMSTIEEQKKLFQGPADRGEIASLKDDLRKAQMSEADLKRQLRLMEEQKAELSKKFASSSQPNTDYSGRIFKVQTDARMVIARQKKESEIVVAKLKDNITDLLQQTREKQEELEQALHSRDVRIQELEEQLEQALSESRELNVQLEVSAARISELEANITEKESMLENLSYELESRSTQMVPEEQSEPQSEARQDYLKDMQSVGRRAGDSLTAALDDIFSDAERALSDSERDAHSKIIKFMHG